MKKIHTYLLYKRKNKNDENKKKCTIRNFANANIFTMNLDSEEFCV